MRILLSLISLAGLITAFWLPAFRDAEGFFDPVVCLVISAAAALLVFSIFLNTPYRRAAGWFSLVLLGQGISLQLIFAGPTVHYQHYRLVQGALSTLDSILYALLVVQLLLVVVGLRPYLRAIFTWVSQAAGSWRTLVILAFFLLFAAFPSREIPAYIAEIFLAGMIALVQLACIVLGVMAIPSGKISGLGDRIDRFVSGSPRAQHSPGSRIDRLAVFCALWVFIIAALLSVFSYERHPHVPDEMAYIFHARYFAEGALSVPAPPVPEATEAYLMDCNQQRCISPVPPGWPAMLAVGAYAGVPWLVNPVLAGINVILLFLVLSGLYGRPTARLGVLLLSVSPWYLLVSMSFMTHTFSLTCALVASLSVIRLREGRNGLWGLLAGAGIGVLSLNRPLEGLMLAAVLGLASLFIRGKWFRFGPVVTLTFSAVVVGALVFPYNKAMTGDPFKFPIMAYADRVLGPGVNSLGFGPDKGASWGGLDPFPGHGFPDVVVNAMLNTDAMNIELFGWSTGSLLFLLAFLLARSTRQHFRAIDGWMLYFIAVIFAFQSLYWFSGGPDFGARYYFLAIIPLIALTVRGMDVLGSSLNSINAVSARGRALVVLAVAVLSFASIVNFLPWRAIDKYHDYRGMRPGIRTLIQEHQIGKALILINGKDHPDLNSALVYSELDPHGNGPVIAWNRNADVRKRLLQAYPDRKIWIVDGPSVTGKGYRVVAGPVTGSQLDK